MRVGVDDREEDCRDWWMWMWMPEWFEIVGWRQGGRRHD